MTVPARHGGQRTRVLVADDHPLTRMGLCRLLARSGMDVVAEAGDGEEAVHQAIAMRPDMALLDVRMPRLGGLEAARRISSACPETRVVMLSGHEGDDQARSARHAGALAYIAKGATTKEILAILDAVMEGRPPPAGAGREAMTEVVTHPSGTIRSAGTPDLSALTEREREVLTLVVQGQSSAVVARTLHLSERTVEKHRQNIMTKLDVHSVVQLTRLAIRCGLA
jgi:DNA-binding NarL/FixJ family response regulator